MSIVKSAALAACLVTGAAFAAQAQSSVAALPPGATTAPVATPIGPSMAYPGPNPGSASAWASTPSGTAPQTQAYVGPAPGAGSYIMPPHVQTSADYDANTALHPYTSSMGPRAN
jgi:hypothetical protein